MPHLIRRQPNVAALRNLAASGEQMRQALACLGLSVVGLAVGVTSAFAIHGI